MASGVPRAPLGSHHSTDRDLDAGVRGRLTDRLPALWRVLGPLGQAALVHAVLPGDGARVGDDHVVPGPDPRAARAGAPVPVRRRSGHRDLVPFWTVLRRALP